MATLISAGILLGLTALTCLIFFLVIKEDLGRKDVDDSALPVLILIAIPFVVMPVLIFFIDLGAK